jgi:hypothetical protein
MTPEIGEMAGRVWFYVNEHPDTTTAKMIKELGGSRDLAQRAIGWLSREDKIVIEAAKGGEKLRLK